jgi:hypothetical protein
MVARLYLLFSPAGELPSLYLFLSEPQRKSKAEHPVNTATITRIIASRVHGSPAERRLSTSVSIVLIHSRAPKTRITCTRRATQARLKNRRTGKSRARMTMGITPCLRKCAPSSKELKTTGSSRRIFIILISFLGSPSQPRWVEPRPQHSVYLLTDNLRWLVRTVRSSSEHPGCVFFQ